jgi:hypothetical protein
METLVNAKTYFAVQAKTYETARDVSRLVLQAAATVGISFKRLESMDILSVGTTNFVRFRSDVVDATPILDALEAQGRGSIRLEGIRYMLRAKGRVGSIPTTRILSAPCVTSQQQVYLGTSVQQWAEQFA